ncbi:MAG: translation initiation factor, partial [Thermoanaerobaculia bacterium]|nr:translation initiation factor [Thermoanaerobaculia bacterium]
MDRSVLASFGMSDRQSKLVYTTDPEEAKRLRESGKMPNVADASPGSQTIRVTIDRKRRRGKTVTVASGFELTAKSLKKLAKELKKKCGAGGSAQGSEIEVQGEHVEKVSEMLQ